MDDFETTFRINGYEDLELSTQILICTALKRGISVSVLDRKDSFIQLKKDGKIEYVRQATMTSFDSLVSYFIMENKAVTKFILQENALSVPEGKVYTSKESALSDYPFFADKDVFVKPNKTNYGIGVHPVLKGNRDAYFKAVNQAFHHDSTILVEEYMRGIEYRFLVIGNQVCGVLRRVPANVVGDLKHTIEELIEIKNRDPKRGKGYVKPLEKITLGEIEIGELERQNMNEKTILKIGQTVYLRQNSNISTGGDSIDVTDQIPDVYKKLAVLATKVVGACICGLDMIIQDLSASPSHLNHAIIELNFNPAIHIHTFPAQGQSRDCASSILNLLGF